jgi:transcriptional regulator with XRE-family HTH domain
MARFNGADIKRLRVEADLTQTQLAEKMKVSQTMISAWETGRVAISGDTEKQLSQLFGRQRSGSSNPFGSWLKREREKRNWTVQELANKAKISAPAIYNIEAGRITTPRGQTKEAIADALNTTIPSDVAELVKSESEIAGLGSFLGFDPHERDEWPDAPGVYVLYDLTDRPVYIGQGRNIAIRIRDHEQKKWFLSPIVETASYIEVPDEQLREQIESLLIKFLKSNAVLNKQKVDREG